MHHLLDLAAKNDYDGVKAAVDEDPAAADAAGVWYGRKVGSSKMGLTHRTPLMVAAAYGSLDVLKLILSISGVSVGRCCGPEKTTALHCAAAGGSTAAVDAVKILLSAGADPNAVDADGHRPYDVVAVSPALTSAKTALEQLLLASTTASSSITSIRPVLRVSTSPSSSSDSSPLSSSADEGGSPSSESTSSPMIGKFDDPPALPERKEYPVDPSLPDIKNSIYAADEFRMYSFKVRPCSRAYSHDWTECPFAHPGENARRRDPRRFNYSCVPCPEFRKGGCRRGDSCEYAHGVFECWLHPAQYRTRLCKDGTSCSRRVCFFAHTPEELRAVYMPAGSSTASPRSSVAIEMAMLSLLPVSPSASASPLSPFADGISHNSSIGWAQQQPNVPMLHLPASNLQSSRLRSSLSARDMHNLDDFSGIMDFEPQQLNEIGSFDLNGNRPIRSNLDNFFAAEISLSPRYAPDHGALLSPSQKMSVLNQLHHQQSRSPFSPRIGGDMQQQQQQCSLLQASLGISSPGRRSIEPLSPLSPHLAALAQREKLQQLHLRSSHDLGYGNGGGVPSVVGSPVKSPLSKWGSPSGKLDWGVNSEELDRFKQMSSSELCSGGDDRDVSWVHSLVSTSEIEGKLAAAARGAQMEDHAVIGAWLEQMQLD